MDGRRVARLACLGLGSNADPARALPRAVAALRRALAVEAVSSAWQSPALGVTGPDFVNAAVLARTRLPASGLTARLKRLEDALGRVRDDTNDASTPEPAAPVLVTIDVDLLVYDGEVLEPGLWDVAYRCVPVSELLPDLACPATGETLGRAACRHLRVAPIRPWPRPLDAPRPARPAPGGAAP